MAHTIDAGVTRTIALGYRRYVRSVLVRDNGDITVVADSGRISQLDTAGLRSIETGTEADLYAVCASNEGDIIAVGKSVVLWGRGSTWTTEPIPNDLIDVCMTPTGRLVAVGTNGTIVTLLAT